MHIVVGHSLQQQQLALELARVLHATSRVVALRILLRRAHVALGVDGVVVAPVGRRRARHAGGEDITAANHANCRHVAAVTVPRDADARGVDVRACCREMLHRGGLIIGVGLTELQVRAAFKGLSATRCSAIVDDDQDESERGARIARIEPIGDQTNRRAAVGVDDDGIFLLGIKRGRKRNAAIEFGFPVGSFAGEEFGRRQAVRLEALDAAFGKRGAQLAVARVEHGLGRGLRRLGAGEHGGSIGSDAETRVMKVAAGHAHTCAGVELRDMQLLLHGDLATPRGEPEFARIFIKQHDLLDGPWTIAHGRDERSIERTQLIVLVTGLLGLPQKALAVLEKAHAGRVVLPGVLLLGDDDAGCARGWIRGEDIEHILAARRARDQKFAAVRRPAHVVDVVLGLSLCP